MPEFTSNYEYVFFLSAQQVHKLTPESSIFEYKKTTFRRFNLVLVLNAATQLNLLQFLGVTFLEPKKNQTSHQFFFITIMANRVEFLQIFH